MSPQSTIVETSESSPRSAKCGGVAQYFWLLLIQTTGVVILLANIVPLYRLMVLDFSKYRPDARPWWAIAGIVLAQAAYWSRMRLRLSLPRPRHILLGHIIHFIARLSFVSVTATFPIMFVTRLPDLRNLNYSPVRAAAILVMFFSLFCWTLELERLAKALQEPDKDA